MSERPYLPTSGTEGDAFQCAFCDRCERDRRFRESNMEEPGCQILADTMAFDITHPRYPKEWIEDENGPRCTAFEPLSDGSYRCDKTPDMFAPTPGGRSP